MTKISTTAKANWTLLTACRATLKEVRAELKTEKNSSSFLTGKLAGKEARREEEHSLHQKENFDSARAITDLRHQLNNANYKLRHMGATIRHLITSLDRLGVLTTFFDYTPTGTDANEKAEEAPDGK